MSDKPTAEQESLRDKILAERDKGNLVYAQWIACADREPKDEEYPVVCLNSEDEPFTASSHASLTCYNARYWMPLPPSPSMNNGS